MYAALARIDQSWVNAEDSRGWHCDTQEKIKGGEQVDSVEFFFFFFFLTIGQC